VLSSGLTNSPGIVNTTSPSPSSTHLTPSTHTPEDVMSMDSTLLHSGSSYKMLIMYGCDRSRALASP
jgi:hypothetical protein